ncbi:MAG: hypothetical protein HRT57_17300, partial [Crocinitomicaceae bacterium]|nr:hypothetical protein [Crocinitomicaceae bacterium]
MKKFILLFFVTLASSISYSQTVFIFDTPGAGTFTVPAGCHTKITVALYG